MGTFSAKQESELLQGCTIIGLGGLTIIAALAWGAYSLFKALF